MSAPLVASPKRLGRPAAAVPREHMTARLPPAYIDRIHRLAMKHDLSVSDALIKIIDVAFGMPRPVGISEHKKVPTK